MMFLVVFSGLVCRAQAGSGTCQLPGTYDYVNVDYYGDGHLVISNDSGMKLTQIHITVTGQVTITHPFVPGDVPVVYNFTYVDQTYYDIEPGNTTISDGVGGCIVCQKGGDVYGETARFHLDYLQVRVENPICK